MRLRTCNNRKARRKRAALEKIPFCYILFEAPYVYMEEAKPHLQSASYDLVVACPKGGPAKHWKFVSRKFCYDKKEHFPSYADAIVWLTKIKLSLTDKPEEYRLFKLAKIVEGYYTRRKRERVTKTTDLTNVSYSIQSASERRSIKQRQLREQRQQQLRYTKIMAKAASKAKRASGVRGNWTAAISDAATSLDPGRDGYVELSSGHWRKPACTN